MKLTVVVCVMGLWLALASAGYAGEPEMVFGKLRYAICAVEDSKTILRNHINLAHLHCPGSGWAYNGFPDRASFDRSMASWKTAADDLRSQGVHPITYIAPHMWYGDAVKRTRVFRFFDKLWQDYTDFLGPRPADPMQWTQLDKGLKPIVYTYHDQSGYYWCLNNPLTRNYVAGVIKMHVAYGSHGVFFDGPCMFGCYCPDCHKQFREFLETSYTPEVRERILSGVKLSEVKIPVNPSNLPLFTAWKLFRCVSLTRFLHDMRAHGRKLCPDFLLTNNYCMWSGDPLGMVGGLGEHPEMYAKEVDILFDEAAYGAGPLLGDDGRRISNSFHYDYLVAAAGDKPAVCTFLGVKDAPPDALSNLAWLEVAESWASQCIKMQQNFRNPQMNEVFRQAGDLQVQHPDLFTPAMPHATVGLWVSLQQALAVQATFGMSVARLLQDQGIAYRMLTDEQISDKGLKGLECVVLPNVPLLSQDQLTALDRFLNGGKGVVVLGRAGTLDQYGFERPADVRGIFAEEAGGTEFARRDVGMGRLAWGSLKLFPRLPPYTRTALAQPAAEKLAQAIRWAARDRMTLLQAPPSPVECRIYRVGTDRLRVYLVNYGVAKDGQVTDVDNVTVTLALPEGTAPTDASAYSNEAPQGEKINLQTVAAGRQTTARLTVPRVHIWTVIDLRLKSKEESNRSEPPG
jgi:hypothetical protein